MGISSSDGNIYSEISSSTFIADLPLESFETILQSACYLTTS